MDAKAKRWVLGPGAGFAVLFVGVAATAGPPPGKRAAAADLVAFYGDNSTELRIGALATLAAAALLVFFAGGLRALLRGPDGEEDLASVAFAGGVVIAVGLTLFAVSTLSLVDGVERELSGDTVSALHTLDGNLFMPTVLGLAVMFLATGVRTARLGTLPLWLAWTSIALAVVAVTPAGPIALYAAPIWVLLVGLLAVTNPTEEENR